MSEASERESEMKPSMFCVFEYGRIEKEETKKAMNIRDIRSEKCQRLSMQF